MILCQMNGSINLDCIKEMIEGEFGKWYNEGDDELWENCDVKDFVLTVANHILKESIDIVEKLDKRVDNVGVPAGYDKDSYQLGVRDAIAEIRERFGIEDE